jgi:hypothetical protein
MAEYIDREAARRMLRENTHRFTVADEHGFTGTVKWSERVIYAEVADNVIATVPAADVRENVRAHWYDVGSLSCRCSVCGCKSNRETAFCPNCGAKMGGAEDG